MRRTLATIGITLAMLIGTAGMATAAPPSTYTTGDETAVWPGESGTLTVRCDPGYQARSLKIVYGKKLVTSKWRFDLTNGALQGGYSVTYYNEATTGGDTILSAKVVCKRSN